MITTTHEIGKKGKRSILIVEDHPILREGLLRVINHEGDLFVVGEAWDTHTAETAVREKKPDLVLVDISLRGSNGLDLIRALKTNYEWLHTLVLSMHDEVLYAERAFRAGAKGYVTKSEPSEILLAAIRKVLAGQYYLSDALISRVFGQLYEKRTEKGRSDVEKLSDRELGVLEMMGQGASTHQIAENLYLSMKTIQTYQQRIKDKLSLKNATELIQYATQWVNENA